MGNKHTNQWRMVIVLTYIAMATTLFTSSCDKNKDSSSTSQTTINKPQLLLYCGITMIRPMSELAAIIEKQENCQIIITKGGSGNLLKSIVENKKGDLYLPGSDRYFSIIDKDYPGIVTRTQKVGQNKAVIMIQKGNPLNLSNDLDQLKSTEYAVEIGNASSGSIGKETQKILEKKGIFEDVIKNAMTLTTDSKDLVKALRKKEADIVINWYAVYTWDDNMEYMDIIEIDEQYCQPQELVLGLLAYSDYPEIANKLIDLACSETGKAIFKKHGLYFK